MKDNSTTFLKERYFAFRVFDPDKFFSDVDFFKIIQEKINKTNIFISQTEYPSEVNFNERYYSHAFKSYKEFFGEDSIDLEDKLRIQLIDAAEYQTIYTDLYSESFAQNVYSFILHPMFYKDINTEKKEIVYVNLKIFISGLAILTFSEFYNNIDLKKISENLYSHTIDSYIPSLFFKNSNLNEPYKYNEIEDIKNIYDAIDKYADIIQKLISVEGIDPLITNFESFYFNKFPELPYEFDNKPVSFSFKRKIVDLLFYNFDEVFTEETVKSYYEKYSYNVYKSKMIFANEFRALNFFSKSKIDSNKDMQQLFAEVYGIDLKNRSKEISDLYLNYYFFISHKGYIASVIINCIFKNFSTLEYNRVFYDFNISRENLIKAHKFKFMNWRNENSVINSKYYTLINLHHWLMEKTESEAKTKILKKNEEFTRKYNDMLVQYSLEKMNNFITIISLILSVLYSYEPISITLSSLGINMVNLHKAIYISFNIIIILLILYFKYFKSISYKNNKYFLEFREWVNLKIIKCLLYLNRKNKNN
ncbi:hypothetical protein [Facklamia miroungae]|uniref:Uncharacterized protein n=1 Tax=Facklamia miroungae TaxID=120956 RepID=A0A1G7PF77_9LACT|nr:hypothetical protein [Facklamia miroungae]NKZ28667.1 hypothetical protein [Facklamia miroungae]SDF84130.1 hypothetical protein SAMN05421791_101208 [Facklamia miroungae]